MDTEHFAFFSTTVDKLDKLRIYNMDANHVVTNRGVFLSLYPAFTT